MKLRVFVALLLASALTACGGGGISKALAPPNGGPGTSQMGTAQVHILVPTASVSAQPRKPKYVSPGTLSFSIAVSGMSQPVVVNLDQSQACAPTRGGMSCNVSISAPTGSVTITITAYDADNAQGHVLSVGTVAATVSATGPNTVNATLNGVLTGIALGLTNSVLPASSSATTTLIVQGLDPHGYVIIGPGNYSDANGNTLSITVTDSDMSGATNVNGSSSVQVTSPANASLTIHYNGTLKSGATVQFSASAAGVTGATTALGIGSSGTTIYVAESDFSQVNAYSVGSSGNVAPSRAILPTLNGPEMIAYDSAGNIYVTDDGGTGNGINQERVNVYAPSASGNAAPMQQIVGSNTGLTAVGGIAVDANGYIWVVNYRSGSTLSEIRAGGGRRHTHAAVRHAEVVTNPPFIAAFAPGANGNVAPVGLIQGTLTAGTGTLLNAPWALAFDPGGNLWVSNSTNVYEFSAAQLATVLANGLGTPYTQAPTAQLTGLPSTPYQIAFDAAGNLYVASGNATSPVEIFTAGSTGAATPARTLTGIKGVGGVALDGAGSVYVSGYTTTSPSNGIINVYPSGTTGSSAPTRSIFEPLPNGENCMGPLGVNASRLDLLDSFCANALYSYPTSASGQAIPSRTIQSYVMYPCGIWEDASGYLYVTSCGGATGGIAVFAPGASGYAQPTRFILEAGPTDATYMPVTVATDAFGNIYGANCVSTQFGVPNLAVYGPSANGTVTPLRTLTGSLTTISGCINEKPQFDAAGNVVIANPGQHAIDFFSANLGSIAPMGMISGSSTGLGNPTGLFVDAAGNIYVAQQGSPGIVVLEFTAGSYTANSSNNIAPARTITSTNTTITFPDDIWVDRSGTIYVSGTPSNVGGLLIFPPGANGSVTPTVLSGTNTRL